MFFKRDYQFFEEFLKAKNYIFPAAESAGDKRKNMKILCDSIIQYYKVKL